MGKSPSPATPQPRSFRSAKELRASECLKELALNPEAQRFYATLNRANLYAIAYRLQTAKRPETKIRRMRLIVDMLARGEKFH
jgi:uncharacterized protein YdeI (YjbR/CyaY-like superfamily)